MLAGEEGRPTLVLLPRVGGRTDPAWLLLAPRGGRGYDWVSAPAERGPIRKILCKCAKNLIPLIEVDRGCIFLLTKIQLYLTMAVSMVRRTMGGPLLLHTLCSRGAIHAGDPCTMRGSLIFYKTSTYFSESDPQNRTHVLMNHFLR